MPMLKKAGPKCNWLLTIPGTLGLSPPCFPCLSCNRGANHVPTEGRFAKLVTAAPAGQAAPSVLLPGTAAAASPGALTIGAAFGTVDTAFSCNHVPTEGRSLKPADEIEDGEALGFFGTSSVGNSLPREASLNEEQMRLAMNASDDLKCAQ